MLAGGYSSRGPPHERSTPPGGAQPRIHGRHFCLFLDAAYEKVRDESGRVVSMDVYGFRYPERTD
jgi:hypothetical protein